MRPTLVLSLLFVLVGLMGVWASYDPVAAWTKFALLVAAVIALVIVAIVGRWWRGEGLGLLAVACAPLAAAVALYFLLTYDWRADDIIKIGPIHTLALWWQAHRAALAGPEDINGNVAGGALAILLPLALEGALWARKRQPLVALLATICLLPVFLAFLLTSSRGAWGGLVAGILVALYLHWRGNSAARVPLRRLGDWLLIGGGIAFILLFGLLLFTSSLDSWISRLPVGATLLNRIGLWRDMVVLVSDYPLTGSGLAATMMVFSSYVKLLHVGFIPHAHSLYLQIAIEQGLPGLALFMGLVGTALWQLWHAEGGASPPLRFGITVALIALLVHGAVDAGVYFSRLVLVQFLPIGYAVALPKRSSAPQPLRQRRVVIGTGGMGLLLLMFLTHPTLRATYWANWGAVLQTKAELSRYQWPEWPIQDALRRAPEVDLAPAIAAYKAALALNPVNTNANRRLGQIELSRGDYEAAHTRFEVAFQGASWQRPTRQLLGESYALAGEAPRAVALWEMLDMSNGQLPARVWWYEHIGEYSQPFKAAVAAWDNR